MNHVMSLYERIGGAQSVQATVALLYDKILSDPLLIPFFKDINVERLRTSQFAFVSMAFGGPTHYSGETMRRAHERLVERGLSDVHFDQVALHLKTSMEDLGVPPGLITEALSIVETTRPDVLNR
ncbi:MAG: group 1 truncated hemoglobin [Alphaproteobacteria bacterium]|nr:group 1 truncated hemoglobin [Alphaproteobacteria bacterium]